MCDDMRHDVLADVFSVMKNTEAIGKKECIAPASSLARDVLKIMQEHKYIGSFEFVDDGKGGKFKVQLLGRINDCNVIRPRVSVGKAEFIKWEKRFLPSHDIGMLIVSTSKGVMDQKAAQQNEVGGKLLGYVY